MRQTNLTDDFSVSAIGLGCSSMSHGYGPADRDDEESVRVIHRAIDYGIDIFDTADVYGPYTNEQLLGRALGSHRNDVTIATKCGLVVGPDGRFRRNGRPEYLRTACEGSLRRLGTDSIGLYQLHRVDPAVPLVETWGALGELVTEGKVRALGISHATCEELELVHSVFPITAVQYELSVWSTGTLDDVLPWSQKNGVGFLAFAPLGRGYLSGHVDHTALGADDSRNRDPRFSPDAMSVNQAIVEGLRAIGARHGVTSAQVAIAWTMAQGGNVVPIPGTRRRHWLRDNAAAVDLLLTPEDLRDIHHLPSAMGEMSWDQLRSTGSPTHRS
ncbi:aldo/keto reductase [Streptosporangium sp. NBC_01755]|uniref:aldo/keto reductase n=1 Tax=unclassified Streptosporangium TaxID=2632669 RepID=UPI002DDB4DC9|nr:MULTISPECIES: aldo/keto reductase [unclassified Streptosporangium]WSA25564.1 aldo/keto reductase [Streptosporangium sp. NBC_01810]WSD03048.1 aldo/keto reductase [Streptosporangium sp. NBC_01755]